MKTYNDGLRWAARWVEDSLNGETNERVIEFGKNMAMTLRAASEVQDVDRCVNAKQNSDSGEMLQTAPCPSQNSFSKDSSESAEDALRKAANQAFRECDPSTATYSLALRVMEYLSDREGWDERMAHVLETSKEEWQRAVVVPDDYSRIRKAAIEKAATRIENTYGIGRLERSHIVGLIRDSLSSPITQDAKSGASPAGSADTVAGSLPHQSNSESFPSPSVPCANCGHSDPHNADAGAIADGCSHPDCECGYYDPASVSEAGESRSNDYARFYEAATAEPQHHQPPEQNLEDKDSVLPKPKAPSHSSVVVSGDSSESAALTPTPNDSVEHAAAGNLAFLLSVIRCGESLSADEEAHVRDVIKRLGAISELRKTVSNLYCCECGKWFSQKDEWGECKTHPRIQELLAPNPITQDAGGLPSTTVPDHSPASLPESEFILPDEPRFALSGHCDNGAHSNCPIPDRCKCACHKSESESTLVTVNALRLAEKITAFEAGHCLTSCPEHWTKSVAEIIAAELSIYQPDVQQEIAKLETELQTADMRLRRSEHDIIEAEIAMLKRFAAPDVQAADELREAAQATLDVFEGRVFLEDSAPIVERLQAALASPVQQGSLGADQPWPLRDVLLKLAEATEHLGHVHNCDCTGWEEAQGVVPIARQYANTLTSPIQPEVSKEQTCSCCGVTNCGQCGPYTDDSKTTIDDPCKRCGKCINHCPHQ